MRFERVLAIVTVALALGAAPTLAAGFDKGVRAGVNAAGVLGDFREVINAKTRWGFSAGVWGAWGTGPLSLETDLGYTQKGAASKNIGTDPLGNPTGSSEATYELDYAQLDLLARLNLPNLLPVRVYGILGPSFALPLSAKVTASGFPDMDIKDDLASVEVGLTGGAGLRFEHGALDPLLEARFTLGLTDVFDDTQLNFAGKTGTFTLSAGVAF